MPERLSNFRKWPDPEDKGQARLPLEERLGKKIEAEFSTEWRRYLKNVKFSKMVGAGLFVAGAFIDQHGPFGNLAGDAIKAAATRFFMSRDAKKRLPKRK